MSASQLSQALLENGIRVQWVEDFPLGVSYSEPLAPRAAQRHVRRLRSMARESQEPVAVVAVDDEAHARWMERVVQGGTLWLQAAAEVLSHQPVEEAALQFFRERQQVLRGFHESFRRDLRRQMTQLEALQDLPEQASRSEGTWPRREEPVRVVVFDCWPALVPLYQGFGGFNRCPLPVEHAVVQRHWAEQYGAEVVYLGLDSLELDLARPPATLEELRTAAWAFFLYSDLQIEQSRKLAQRAAERRQHHWVCTWP